MFMAHKYQRFKGIYKRSFYCFLFLIFIQRLQTDVFLLHNSYSKGSLFTKSMCVKMYNI